MFAADLHIRDCTSDKYIADIVHMLSHEDADMLLLGGDYGESSAASLRFCSALSSLKFPMGIYGVVGNNDYEAFGGDYSALVEAFPGDMLINDVRHVSIGSHRLYIAGTDEYKYGKSDAGKLIPRDTGGYSVLLSHYPCLPTNFSGARPRLMLSGHTHAGQIDFMGLTAYSLGMEKDTVQYIRGMHRPYPETQVFVSPGVGLSKMPIRFGARPVIHLIEFI